MRSGKMHGTFGIPNIQIEPAILYFGTGPE
jgi:hypothetical protein